MSFVQQILNRRLGVEPDIIPSTVENTPPIGEADIETSSNINKTDVPQPPRKKNERGAGRKKINRDELEKKKEKIVERLAKSKDEDIETIKEISSKVNKEDIKKEIINSKKRLQLLSDAFNFVD